MNEIDIIKVKRCFAIDYSGSTQGEKFYHENIKDILSKKYENNDEIIVWDHNSKYITFNDYMKINNNLEGFGGTNPKCIFSSIFEKHKKVIYDEFVLITDGQIYEKEVEECSELIENNKTNFIPNYVEVYLIGNKNSTNLSVVCPFTRYSSSKTILKSPDEKEDNIINEVSADDLNILKKIKNISTLVDFNKNYESIEKAFIARLLGTKGDIELRKEVLLMQRRINKNLAKEVKTEKKTTLLDDLLLKDQNFELATNELCNNFNIIATTDFCQKINLLIRMSDGALKQMFNINELQTFRKNIASNTKNVEINDIENIDIESSVKDIKFECPISAENETDPTILLTLPNENEELKPLLLGFEKVSLEKILNCPLNALYNDDFINKIKLYIDHPISLKTLREAEEKGYPFEKSPITRKTIIGAITLGESEEHVKCADYNLMKLLTGGKNLGDRNLWFVVIWILVKKGIFPYLKDIEPFIKAQVIYRMKNYTTSISLSGLSNLPQNKVLYITAAWSCLMSPFIIDKIPSNCNLFNVHLTHYKELVDIINLFNLQLPKNFENFANRMVVFSYLLYFFKRNTKLFENYVNGLKYNTIIVNVDESSPLNAGGIVGEVFIPIDGEINEENRMKCIQKLPKICLEFINEKKISIDELSWLMSFVNVQKQLSDIKINDIVHLDEKDIPKPTINSNWKRYDDNIDKFNQVKISPKTLRPYYQINEKETWKDSLSKIVDINLTIISGHKEYGNFIIHYDKYPTLDEYLLLLYRKYKREITLPKYIQKYAQSLFNEYEKVIKDISVEQFKIIFNKSASIKERIEMEKEK